MTISIEAWTEETARQLNASWGLDRSFASKAALLLLYFYYYGLSPVITSGWRSSEKQKNLEILYHSGDPSVIAKPATTSLHLKTDWLGKPASRAIDVSTNNHYTAALIAQHLKIRAGYFFSTPDPVHFDDGS